MFTYDSNPERIGRLKGEIFRHSVPRECLAASGDPHKQPKNSSKTVVYRSYLPLGGATTNSTTINQWVVNPTSFQVNEGATPPARSLKYRDITVTLKQYAVLYSYTDVAAEVYEDGDIPEQQARECGEAIGLINELIHWGALKACTNVFYAGGTSRATVDKPISLNILRLVTRSLQSNRADMLRERLDPSPDFNTSPVEARYVVYAHTNLASDIRDIEGFIPKAKYSNYKTMHEMELGSVEEFCFVTSPEFDNYVDSGAALGQTGLLSTSGSLIDVYPVMVIAKEAWGHLALRGENSITPNHIPHTLPSKEDPLNRVGYVGARWWMASFIKNDGWMAKIECGARNLTT